MVSTRTSSSARACSGETGGDRTIAAASTVPPFRFSRLGPQGVGHELGDENLKKIAAAMTSGQSTPASGVPAGFTYLGQFVDHDLTFDRTAVMLGQNVTPAQMLQGRSPRLDLDSLYGAGPQDPGSAKFYEADGLHLKVGNAIAAGGAPALPGHDLPRGTTRQGRDPGPAERREPRRRADAPRVHPLPQPRRRHAPGRDAGGAEVLEGARARDQALPVDDPDRLPAPDLPRDAVVDDVFTNGRKAFEVGASPTDVPTMPIEFSVAAYRLGHSMIRAAYNWNKDFDAGTGALELPVHLLRA